MKKLFLMFYCLALAAFTCENVDFSCPAGATYPIHLTFDDGPHDYNTGRILDILKDEKVPATFFMQILKLVDRQGTPINYSGRRQEVSSKGISNYYYYLMDRMRDEGHFIGSHTYEHLHHFEADNWQENIKAGNPAALSYYFNHKSSPLIRLPHGQGWFEQTSTNPDKKRSATEIMNYLEQMGMVHVGWNIDPLDWRYSSKELTYKISETEFEHFPNESEMNRHYQQSIADQICSQRGGIVLMHDAKEITWKNLRCVISGLKSAGHNFTDPAGFIEFERSWGAPLIGPIDREPKLCFGCFDRTTSPLEAERMAQFEEFILYIIRKYSDL